VKSRDCVRGSIGNSHTNADFLSMGHTDGFSGLGKSYRQIAISEGEKQFTAMEPNKKIIIEHRNGFKYSMCYV